ncbi:hypothetical protein ISF_09839 [Cordyceps fumosorosea ARSEF 2679]|uniref:Uncharacterized protein n=1 Tax=Cordyceps fumosorosea (strain ARSEF 2679) TaxID=1081104 RepID=A0A167BE11_CORFA|nr:hypothetical protein ISF_09839 [Cordyceps fumosorosea ARSEF 2679]OAA39937.1 hypothetical protein ISF_09839 [Cordyceps fumosorosea ARSEF 2679]
MAENELHPVFQDWMPAPNACFDIQILEPQEADTGPPCRKKLLNLVKGRCKRLKVETSELQDGVLAIRFARTSSSVALVPFEQKAECLCNAILNYRNTAEIAKITARGAMGISPRSVQFDDIFRKCLYKIACGRPARLLNNIDGAPTDQLPPWVNSFALSIITDIPVYKPSAAMMHKAQPRQAVEAAGRFLEWLINSREDDEDDDAANGSLVIQLQEADELLAGAIASMAISTRRLQGNVTQGNIRQWHRHIDEQSYLVLQAASRILLSNDDVLARFLALYRADDGPGLPGLLGGLGAALSIGSIGTASLPLSQFTFAHFAGLLTTLTWPTIAVINPVTLTAGLGIAMAALIGHLNGSDARKVAARLKRDLEFVCKALRVCREVDLLQKWIRTASGGNVLRLSRLRSMDCPETVNMWTEFVAEVRDGSLAPRFSVNNVSRTALDSRGKRAETRDVRLYLSYLLVARPDEVDSDSDD